MLIFNKLAACNGHKIARDVKTPRCSILWFCLGGIHVLDLSVLIQPLFPLCFKHWCIGKGFYFTIYSEHVKPYLRPSLLF